MLGSLSIAQVLIVVGVLLVSMTVHEAMHAFVGLRLGDDTAAEEGRISLNPLKHIDPFMTVLLPAITLLVFGAPILAAKPVPFNPDRVNYGELGAAMIAAAGPLSNLVLALLGVLAARAAGLDVQVSNSFVSSVLYVFILLNVSLFVFNLIPIPPLDGSRVLYAFAPEPLQRLMQQIEPFGFFIIIGLVVIGGFGSVIGHLNELVLNFLL